jgi:hypothetical protein
MLNLRMVEGVLLRGDWAAARRLVTAWHCPEGGDCRHGQSCMAHRGYLHHVALTVKIMGMEAARKHLAHALPVPTPNEARILPLQMANSSSVYP